MNVKNQNGSNEKQTSATLYSIDELQQKKNTPVAIYKGMCVAYGWRPGKMVTEADYMAAVEAFSKSPIGKKVKNYAE